MDYSASLDCFFRVKAVGPASKEGSNKDQIALGSKISVEHQNFQGGMKAQVRLQENFMPAWNLIPPLLSLRVCLHGVFRAGTSSCGHENGPVYMEVSCRHELMIVRDCTRLYEKMTRSFHAGLELFK